MYVRVCMYCMNVHHPFYTFVSSRTVGKSTERGLFCTVFFYVSAVINYWINMFLIRDIYACIKNTI